MKVPLKWTPLLEASSMPGSIPPLRVSIPVDGLVTEPLDLKIGQLPSKARPLGLHLLECAGNTRAAHFGMISAGEWAGVPLSEILLEAKQKPSATQVLISGFDRYISRSATST